MQDLVPDHYSSRQGQKSSFLGDCRHCSDYYGSEAFATKKTLNSAFEQMDRTIETKAAKSDERFGVMQHQTHSGRARESCAPPPARSLANSAVG
jgi:hypothetical protein